MENNQDPTFEVNKAGSYIIVKNYNLHKNTMILSKEEALELVKLINNCLDE